MGVSFDGTTGNFLNASPSPLLSSTGVPVTMACWVKNPSSNADFISFGRDNAQNSIALGLTNTGAYRLSVQNGGVFTNLTGGATTSGNPWTFVLGRFISATNRRIHSLTSLGVSSAQDTTSVSITGLNTLALGCNFSGTQTRFSNCVVAEAWWAVGDIYGDGSLAADDAFVRQLALGGPFWMDNINAKVVEYFSCRDFTSTTQAGPMNGIRTYGPATAAWLPTSSTQFTDHPPLPAWYIRPQESYGIALV